MDRRTFLAALGAGTASIAGCTGTLAGLRDTPNPNVPLAPVEGDWPTYQFDAGRTGYNPTSGTPHDERDGHWTVEMEASSTSPAVADGTVYVGGADGAVYAIDAQTGAQRWKAPLVASDHNNVGWTTPTVDSGLVYVASELGTSSSETLYALDGATGEERWNHRIPDRGSVGDIVIADGVVVVSTASRPENGTTVESIAALNVKTGAVEWRYDISRQGGWTNLAVADGTVFYGAGSTTYALDLVAGELLWFTKLVDVGWIYDLAVSDGRVFRNGRASPRGGTSSTGATMDALDAQTGDQHWVYSPGEESTATTEEPVGSTLLPIGRAAASGRGPLASPPTIADGRVFVSTRNHGTHVVDVATGHLEWTVDVGEVRPTSGVRPPPVVSDGRVYLTDGKTVQTFDAATGRRSSWLFAAHEGVWRPIVVDGVVFVLAGSYLQALTGRKAN